MNKLILLGIAATLGAARLAFFPTNPPVDLQPTSPGTAQTGHLNITGTATVGLLKSQGTVFGASTAPTGFAYGGFFTAASNQARGFYGYASSPTGLTYGGFFQNASDSGRAVYGLATSTTGFNYGGYFQTASDAGRGVLGVAASATGTTYGVYGKAVSPNGYGVYSDGNLGVSGVISGDGSGLTAVNATKLNSVPGGNYQLKNSPIYISGSYPYPVQASTGAGSARALYGLSWDTAGINYGVYAESAGSDGRGVLGYATNSTGTGRGIYGRSDGSGGFGVYGYAPSTTGITTGVYAKVASPDGAAFSGANTATTGAAVGLSVTTASTAGLCGQFWANALSGNTLGLLASNKSTAGYAFFAQALGASGTTYGVYSRVDSPTGFGIATNGKLSAGGTKSFRIDDPRDPEHSYLLHYCSESPYPQNFYTGNITTDETGYAWVTLPDYFEDINANYKYQLTVVDDADADGFVMAKVSKVIRGNRFQVRTSTPKTTVSWRVDADRNDRFVRSNRPSDVEPKVGAEAGTYVHPQLYGKPLSKAMGIPDSDREQKRRNP